MGFMEAQNPLKILTRFLRVQRHASGLISYQFVRARYHAGGLSCAG